MTYLEPDPSRDCVKCGRSSKMRVLSMATTKKRPNLLFFLDVRFSIGWTVREFKHVKVDVRDQRKREETILQRESTAH